MPPLTLETVPRDSRTRIQHRSRVPGCSFLNTFCEEELAGLNQAEPSLGCLLRRTVIAPGCSARL